MDREKTLITTALMDERVADILAAWFRLPTKTPNASTQARNEGNKLFVARDNHNARVHEEIWKLYSRSIAHAPNESEELALGYGNRSALLLHLEKFEESIIDIERALKITGSSTLKEKLLNRKKTCLDALSELKKKKISEENSNNAE